MHLHFGRRFYIFRAIVTANPCSTIDSYQRFQPIVFNAGDATNDDLRSTQATAFVINTHQWCHLLSAQPMASAFQLASAVRLLLRNYSTTPYMWSLGAAVLDEYLTASI